MLSSFTMRNLIWLLTSIKVYPKMDVLINDIKSEKNRERHFTNLKSSRNKIIKGKFAFDYNLTEFWVYIYLWLIGQVKSVVRVTKTENFSHLIFLMQVSLGNKKSFGK